VNQTKKIISTAVGVVSYIFFAFGGALSSVRPPEQSPQGDLVAQMAKFGCLIALLFLSAVNLSGKAARTLWWTLALLVSFILGVISYLYYGSLTTYTYAWPDNSTSYHVRGPMQLSAVEKEAQNEGTAEVLKGHAGDDGYNQRYGLWLKSGENKVRSRLDSQYASLTVLLAADLFALAQLIQFVKSAPAKKGSAG
jgi:hypothetical protein